MSAIPIPTCLIVTLVALSNCAAQTKTKIVVHVGEFDRAGAIVECPIDAKTYGERGFIWLVGPEGGAPIGGQIGPPKLNSNVPENCSVLTFILPKSLPLKSGASLEFTSVSGLSSVESFGWTDYPSTHRELTLGARPVLRYVYEPRDTSSPARIDESFKAYHHLYNPAGTSLVTKGTGGLYPHHRGLSYAFNGISYGDQHADIWHCRDGEYESHEKFVSDDVGPVYGRHQVQIDWHGRDGAVFASEIRELTAYNVDGVNLIEFRSRLTTTLPQVRLGGDPQHAGFQFRAAQEVADQTKEQTYYLRPDGKDQPGVFRNWSSTPEETEINRAHVDLPWNALSFVLGAQRYTCCYLDHPANPKPARFSERDYGRFGSYFEFELTADRPLAVQYRLWLQVGEMTGEEVNGLSRDFSDPCAANSSSK